MSCGGLNVDFHYLHQGIRHCGVGCFEAKDQSIEGVISREEARVLPPCPRLLVPCWLKETPSWQLGKRIGRLLMGYLPFHDRLSCRRPV